MPDVVILLVGLVILALVFADRDRVREAWRRPARWYAFRNPEEVMEARSPAQPGNVLVGIILGAAAVIYGIVGLVT
jgi:hypothetical protein